ncbi:MAG TPA: hypothetical protein VIM55_06590 [Mucilaginibacter sp.]
MKKLTSIKNSLYQTLEPQAMKQLRGGYMPEPTATGPSPIVTVSKSTGQTTNDGTNPGSNNDGDDNT